MSERDKDGRSGPTGLRWFQTTHWSVVLGAVQANEEQARNALEALCRSYWLPLYSFVRKQGYSPEDAQDLTQGFFARLIEKDYLRQVDRRKGRFRSFLLASLRHYLCDERDRVCAVKRGGRQTFVSIDQSSAEACLDLTMETDAERLYDRQWAMAVLDKARSRLREECEAAGKGKLHALFRAVEAGEGDSCTYARLGAELGMTESAVKNAVPRLRRRYQDIIREEISQTVSDPVELEEEIRYLISVLSG